MRYSSKETMRSRVWAAVSFAIGLGLLMTASEGSAQLAQDSVSELDAVGITEKFGESVPTHLAFIDERGTPVQLGDYFGSRPVILSLTYSSCPMLCHHQLDGMVEALRQLDLEPGKDFEIVNVSIDPDELPSRALMTKQKHVKAYGRPETAGGWHFLVGNEANVRQLANAVGFRYQFVPERNEYAHAAALFVATPDGVLSRYLYGISFPNNTLRLALVEAGEGAIGTPLDQIILFCFHYDADSRGYAPAAIRIMQLAGITTVICLAIGLLPFWLRRTKVTATAKRTLTKAEQASTVSADDQ